MLTLAPALALSLHAIFCQASDHPRCGIALAGHASVEHQFLHDRASVQRRATSLHGTHGFGARLFAAGSLVARKAHS